MRMPFVVGLVVPSGAKATMAVVEVSEMSELTMSRSDVDLVEICVWSQIVVPVKLPGRMASMVPPVRTVSRDQAKSDHPFD